MKYLPNNSASYFPDSRTPHEFLSSKPPAEKNGVLPKISRKGVRSIEPSPHESRNLCFSVSLWICS